MKGLLIKYGIDLFMWGTAAMLAYLFRSPQTLSSALPLSAWAYLLLSLLVMAAVNWRYQLARQTWGRIGMLDLSTLLRAVGTATLIIFALGFVLRGWLLLPRSVPLMAGVLGVLLMGGVRILTRMANERVRRSAAGSRQRVLIVGAGNAGSLIAREMQRHPEAGLHPIGFLDDDRNKLHKRVVGLPVFGRVDDLPTIARREAADEILIAAPSAAGDFVRRVVDLARDVPIRHRIIPGVIEILSGNINIHQIRDVDVEDLLRRPPVKLNTERDRRLSAGPGHSGDRGRWQHRFRDRPPARGVPSRPRFCCSGAARTASSAFSRNWPATGPRSSSMD